MPQLGQNFLNSGLLVKVFQICFLVSSVLIPNNGQIQFGPFQQFFQQQESSSVHEIMTNVLEEVTQFQAAAVASQAGLPAKHNYCKFTPTTEKIGHVSNLNMKTYEVMLKQHSNIPKREVLKFLSKQLPDFCHRTNKPFACDGRSKYRTIDGTCNNIQKPFLGSAYTQFDRLVPAAYEDGLNEPRGGKGLHAASRLPNPRLVSQSIHHDFLHPHIAVTNMLPQFGQFLDHDISLSPEGDKRCCSSEKNEMDCWKIDIYTNDPFYSNLTRPQKCMDFTRSTPYCFPTHSGVREQMNIVTSFVDGSHIYASEPAKAKQLREFYGGRFRVNSQSPGLLPAIEEVEAKIGEKIELMGHFLGGEERVNEMPALTVMHTLFFREHNRLADQIREKRPFWNDEQIYQEARRIVIAEWQNIVFDEYLPILLGDQTMSRYGLTLGYQYSQYNGNIDPSILHSFATAAYRFGHTLINGIVRLYRGLMEVGNYRLRHNFFNPEQILIGNGEGYDLILNGLMVQNAQTYDPFVTEELTNFLLREKEHDFGSDLIARNLQRGREHGMQSYSVYRQLCGLGALDSWSHRPINILQPTWFKLQQLYTNPEDIDLFTGGLSELPVKGGITGATFNCLKAMQFARLKFGDRFFFTHSGQTGSFTPEQMREIRGRKLGDVICQNSRLEMATLNVFKIPSLENPLAYCNDPRRSSLNIDIFLN